MPNVLDLKGLTRTDAEAALTALGLVIGDVTNIPHETIAVNSVVSQTPAAGTSVAAGSAVKLEVSSGPAQVAVPNLKGLTRTDAEAALTALGLVIGDVTNIPHETIAVNSVVSQTPAAGTSVAAGSAVKLEVSSGPAQVAVPNLKGLTRTDAEAALTALGLVIGDMTNIPHDTIAVNSVVSQTPAAGTSVAAGSAVKLEVSSGPAQVAVPNLKGLTRTDAEAALTALGLVIGDMTNIPHDTIAVNSVVNQTPAAGTSVAAGSAVKLEVSSGPAQVAVPNLKGLTRTDAEAALTGVGLVVGAVTATTLPHAGVIGETPVPGTLVNRGSLVNIEISTAKWYERIPWTNLIFFFLGLILLAAIVFGMWTSSGFLASLANTENARGLITFLIAITTVGIALILAISTVVLKGGDEDDKRFDRGKQVLTMLIGILGTIVGFYFGSSLNSDRAQPASLAISGTKLDNPQPEAGATITLAGTVTGKEPYVYVITFTPPVISPVAGASPTGTINQQIAIPNTATATDVTYVITVTDAGGASAKYEDKLSIQPKTSAEQK